MVSFSCMSKFAVVYMVAVECFSAGTLGGCGSVAFIKNGSRVLINVTKATFSIALLSSSLAVVPG